MSHFFAFLLLSGKLFANFCCSGRDTTWNVILAQAKQWVSALDQRRFERALQGSGDAFQHVLAIAPLLLHLNHPQLPGYVIHAPSGIANFLAS